MSCGFACTLCGKCNKGSQPDGGGSRLSTAPRGLCDACGTLNRPSAKVCAQCGAELKVPERKVFVPGLDKSDNPG
ncbi:MAG: hypothetical protein V8R08_00130 [Coriobacteriales bacterium]